MTSKINSNSISEKCLNYEKGQCKNFETYCCRIFHKCLSKEFYCEKCNKIITELWGDEFTITKDNIVYCKNCMNEILDKLANDFSIKYEKMKKIWWEMEKIKEIDAHEWLNSKEEMDISYIINNGIIGLIELKMGSQEAYIYYGKGNRKVVREVYLYLDNSEIFEVVMDEDDYPYPVAGIRGTPEWLKRKVFRRDGNKCLRCGSKENLQCDHIIPFSCNGRTVFENLQTLCRGCNLEKGIKTIDYRKKTQKEITQYN